MSERAQDSDVATQASAPGEGTHAPAQPAASAVHAMVARGRHDPAAIAAMLQSNPGAQNEILVLLNQTLGHGFVRAVLDLLAPSTGASAGGPMRVIANGLHVRSAPSQLTDDNIIGALPHHAIVSAVGREGDWVKIDHHSGPAFVFGQYVEPAAKPHGPATAASATPATATPAIATPVVAHHDAPVVAHHDAPVAAHHDAPVAEHHDAPAPAHSPSPAPAHSPAPAPAPAPAHSHSPAPAPAHSPAPAPAPAPAHSPVAPVAAIAAHHDPENEFVTASGNAIAKTTTKEAEVLNKIRREPRRFDPVWLATAQHNLGVTDATGAFNTETLRAMRDRAHKPALDAAGIMDEGFLTSLAPGTPFHEGTEVGTLAHKQEPAAGATSPKDRTAQDMGYASFAAYREMWGDDAVTFLGNDFGTPAHPYLRARIRVAETYLRNRVTSPDGRKLDDAGIMKAINWNGKGNASYAHQPGDHMTHQHAMGLAIDIEPGQNPYLFDHSIANADFWVGLFEHLFRHATKLFGGEPLTAATMNEWSKQSSTEELFQRVSAASQSFAQMLALSARARGDESATGEISTKLAHAGYEGEALKTAVHEVAVANHHFHQQEGRASAKAPTNLTQEMVIALRDVAGLAWGGTEMSSIENGDFMHFDCRLTDYGHAVYEAGRKHYVK
jgi:hypothetical protein